MDKLTSPNPVSKNDIYLFHEGSLFHSYRMLGSHVCEEGGILGVRFTVWAPDAHKVSIASDWNEWRGEHNNDVLYKLPDSGIWSRFFPDVQEGTLYKYEVTAQDGSVFLKSDPYAYYAEVRPATASIVKSISGYNWRDSSWKNRQLAPYQQPLNIYELHFGTWKHKEDGTFYSYREMADLLIPYVVQMGYTHIEIMPLCEHPYDLSWGYQITGYFAPTSRYGEPKDLMYFVDCCHAAGIGVLLDWVPGHFTRDDHGLRMFDGTPLFEYSDSQKADKPGWGTLSFDFGKPEVRSFLISNAIYWLSEYHFDGLRVDAVTSMLRLDFEKGEGQYSRNHLGGVENLEAITFLQQLNKIVFQYFPHALMMAEESSAWPLVTAPVEQGGLGFNYKWNMGWMNDTLAYVETPFWNRPEHHNLLTFPICYAYSENYILPLSHDEVVHGKKSLLDKMPGTYEQKFAGLRLLLGYQMTFPGKKLMFMGGEFGQFIEWRDQAELDWFLLDYDSHLSLQKYVAALNYFYKDHPALWEQDHHFEGYEWINPDDMMQSVICYLRKSNKTSEKLVILINFQPVQRENYRIGVPEAGLYTQLFNSDALAYGGDGIDMIDYGDTETECITIQAEKIPWHNRTYSISLTLPPLSMSIWKIPQSPKKKLRRTTS